MGPSAIHRRSLTWAYSWKTKPNDTVTNQDRDWELKKRLLSKHSSLEWTFRSLKKKDPPFTGYIEVAFLRVYIQGLAHTGLSCQRLFLSFFAQAERLASDKLPFSIPNSKTVVF